MLEEVSDGCFGEMAGFGVKIEVGFHDSWNSAKFFEIFFRNLG
jgi:hypothetical protein